MPCTACLNCHNIQTPTHTIHKRIKYIMLKHNLFGCNLILTSQASMNLHTESCTYILPNQFQYHNFKGINVSTTLNSSKFHKAQREFIAPCFYLHEHRRHRYYEGGRHASAESFRNRAKPNRSSLFVMRFVFLDDYFRPVVFFCLDGYYQRSNL